MRYFVTLNDRTVEVDLSGPAPTVDGRPVRAELVGVAPGLYHLLVDGRSVPVVVEPGATGGQWELSIRGRRLVADVVDERTRAIRAMSGGGAAAAEKVVTAPMPGLVVRVEVQPGERVRAGQGVVVVEAMKMENELKAPADGLVAGVYAEAGQTVEKGAVLLVLE
ncbi:MAG TPA: biotin/lipoyl-containing protein [Longimicrobiaceae bacterium]|nr:biotin/lipoyl-containing protein [Longimicrobiaceae bacterium]